MGDQPVKLAAIVFLIVASISALYIADKAGHMFDEWAKVADNVNRTFEELKPKDDIRVDIQDEEDHNQD
jgi:hypothetical protein